MDMERLEQYALNIAALRNDFRMIVVSSGAVVSGRYLWSQSDYRDLNLSERSAAMLGSANVVTAWQQALGGQSLLASQLLVTHREIEGKEEGPSLIQALQDNLAHGIITIVNENDGLSVLELKKLAYGEDNDGLAAHLAITLNASALILMSDIDGLLRPGEGIMSVVGASVADRLEAQDCVRIAKNSTKGGGRTKVEALIRAADAGIEGYWAHARANFKEVLAGKTGTHFVARRITGNIFQRGTL